MEGETDNMNTGGTKPDSESRNEPNIQPSTATSAGTDSEQRDKIRKIVMWVIVAAVVLGAITGLVTTKNFPSAPRVEISGEAPITREPPLSAETAKVPGVGDRAPENVAVPKSVSPVLAGSENQRRELNISVNKTSFIPDTIIVNQGDSVRINLTGFGGAYEVSQPDYGLRQTVSDGETKRISFRATAPGTFMFYCNSCGGPEEGPKGSLVVVPKK